MSRYNGSVTQNGMMEVVSRLDRTLSGQKVRSKLSESCSTAFTSWDKAKDEWDVTFANTFSPDMLLSVNYHELGHILFTPLAQWLNHADRMVYNILEDARTECLMIKKYPTVRSHLTRVYAKVVHPKKGQYGLNNYALLYGRKYLPPEVAAKAKSILLNGNWNPRLIDGVERVLDEYVLLTSKEIDSNDGGRPERLVQELKNLIGYSASSEMHGGEQIGAGRSTNPPENDSLDQQDIENMSTGAGEGEQQQGKGDDQDSDSDEESDGAGSGGDSSDEDQDSGGDSNGSGSGDSSDDSSDDLEDVVRNMFEQASEELSDELDTMNKEADKLASGGHVRSGDVTSYKTVPTTPVMQHTAHKFADGFKSFIDAADSGWERGQHYGSKINIPRVISQRASGEIWDRWEEDQLDDTSVCVVLGLDHSSSMGHQIEAVVQTEWVLIKAFSEMMNVEFHSYRWGSYTYLNYKTGDPVLDVYQHPRGGLDGSTEPESFFNAAADVFAATEKKNKLMILMTDGHFTGDSSLRIEGYRALQGLGAYLYGIEFGGNAQIDSIERIYWDTTIKIDNVSQVADIAADITLKIAQEGVHRW